MRVRWWAVGACAAAAVLLGAAIAPGSPPAYVWYDGDRFAAPPGTSLDGFHAEPMLFGHCGLDGHPRSASGVVLPRRGDPVLLARQPSFVHRALRKLKLVAVGSRQADEYVYDRAADGADHRDAQGTIWFRYDLRAEGDSPAR